MGYADSVLGAEREQGSSDRRVRDGDHGQQDDSPWQAANSLDPHEVLPWLEVELDGDNLVRCPSCGADGRDSSVSIVGRGFKCQHASCSSKGSPAKPGYRSVVDMVAEVRGVTPAKAVNLLAKQFGTPPLPRRAKKQSRGAPPPKGEADEEALLGLLYGGRTGDQLLAGFHNAILLVRNDPALTTIAFNALTQRIVLRGENDREWTDEDTHLTTARYEAIFGWQGSDRFISEAATIVAKERAFHPLQDYLTGLVWDGAQRIDTWLIRHAGAADTPYNRTVFSKWMISAVARAMRPGCKVDQVLVLQGKQGGFKSTFLRALVGDEYFTDQLPPMTNGRDFEEALLGMWVAELSELDHLSQTGVTTVKAVVVRQIGRCRLPYAKRTVALPRTVVFAGTTNEDEFLRDATGDRRFWPVHVERCDHLQAVVDRDQLWAEAYHRFASGECWHLDDSAEEGARREQAARYRVDPWEPEVLRFVSTREWVATQDVLTTALERPLGQVEPKDQGRVVRILKRLGGARRQRRINGKQVWGYEAPDGGWCAPEDREAGGEAVPAEPVMGEA